MSHRRGAAAVIATAGHVDHGKTSLVRALTGTDTDRLPEERRRGMTLELGFAELAPAGVSFIDVPGHRTLVHAMIAGAGGALGLLLAVAADDGVMPQTREHLHAARLLGIRRVLVAITKTDLAEDARLAQLESELRDALERLDFVVHAVVRTSVRTLAGIAELSEQVGLLAAATPPENVSERALLAVDRVFAVAGAGPVVTGTLVRGRLTVGQELFFQGRRGLRRATCRALEIHGRGTTVALAAARVAVNVSRIEKDDIERGDVLASYPDVLVTTRLDVALHRLPGVELHDGASVVVHLGTARSAARVRLIDEAFAELLLSGPIAALGGMAFVLRGFSATDEHGAVVGGGRVVDAEPAPLPRRRDVAARAGRARALAHAQGGRLGDAALSLLDEDRPLDGERLGARLGAEPGTLTAWLSANSAVQVGAGSFTTACVLERLADQAVAVVAAHHERAPHEHGVSRETVRSGLAERVGTDAAEVALRHALDARRLSSLPGGLLATPSFVEASRSSADEAERAVLAALERAAFVGMDEAALANDSLPPAAVRVVLGRLASLRRARRLGSLWFAEAVVDEARARVREHLGRGLSLRVSDFKAMCGVPRKQAIFLLEQLDRDGITRRDAAHGDVRLAGPVLRE